ncbi:hypothetical protein CCP4SC76_5140005 [Gammaproteobacteria bacterium]
MVENEGFGKASIGETFPKMRVCPADQPNKFPNLPLGAIVFWRILTSILREDKVIFVNLHTHPNLKIIGRLVHVKTLPTSNILAVVSDESRDFTDGQFPGQALRESAT